MHLLFKQHQGGDVSRAWDLAQWLTAARLHFEPVGVQKWASVLAVGRATGIAQLRRQPQQPVHWPRLLHVDGRMRGQAQRPPRRPRPSPRPPHALPDWPPTCCCAAQLASIAGLALRSQPGYAGRRAAQGCWWAAPGRRAVAPAGGNTSSAEHDGPALRGTAAGCSYGPHVRSQ